MAKKRSRKGPGFYAVLPGTVRYDDRLSPNAKLFYAEVSALAGKEGYCYADNTYFMNLYGVDERSIQRWISQLIKAGHLYRKLTRNRRRLYLSDAVDEEKNDIPEGDRNVAKGVTKKSFRGDRNVQSGVTEMSFAYNRNKDISNDISNEREKPSLENVSSYFSDNDFNSNPEVFFYHYEARGWNADWELLAKKWEAREKQFTSNSGGVKTYDQQAREAAEKSNSVVLGVWANEEQ